MLSSCTCFNIHRSFFFGRNVVFGFNFKIFQGSKPGTEDYSMKEWRKMAYFPFQYVQSSPGVLFFWDNHVLVFLNVFWFTLTWEELVFAASRRRNRIIITKYRIMKIHSIQVSIYELRVQLFIYTSTDEMHDKVQFRSKRSENLFALW